MRAGLISSAKGWEPHPRTAALRALPAKKLLNWFTFGLVQRVGNTEKFVSNQYCPKSCLKFTILCAVFFSFKELFQSKIAMQSEESVIVTHVASDERSASDCVGGSRNLLEKKRARKASFSSTIQLFFLKIPSYTLKPRLLCLSRPQGGDWVNDTNHTPYVLPFGSC